MTSFITLEFEKVVVVVVDLFTNILSKVTFIMTLVLNVAFMAYIYKRVSRTLQLHQVNVNMTRQQSHNIFLSMKLVSNQYCFQIS